MQRLRDQVKAQDEWKTNMLILAGRVSQGTLEELARMGPEGAPLVADLVTKSDDILKEYGVITAARSKEATDAWGANLTMASPVLTALAEKARRVSPRGPGSCVRHDHVAQSPRSTASVSAASTRFLIRPGKRRIPGGRRGAAGVRRPMRSANADGGMERMTRADRPAVTGGCGPSRKPLVRPAFRSPVEASCARHLAANGAHPRRPGGEYFASAGSPRRRYAEAVINGAGPAADSSPPTLPCSASTTTITAWLKANVGTAGTGHLTGGVSGMFAAVKARFPEAKLNSGFRPGDPGYHGLGRAIDLGQIGRAGGNGHPYLANMNRWLHDTFGANLAELIYDGLGDDRPDLKNGRPLTYSAGTRAQHRNHVHVAMAKGGILNPHVRD